MSIKKEKEQNRQKEQPIVLDFSQHDHKFFSEKSEVMKLLTGLDEELRAIIDQKTAYSIMESTSSESLKYTSGQLAAFIVSQLKLQEIINKINKMEL